MEYPPGVVLRPTDVVHAMRLGIRDLQWKWPIVICRTRAENEVFTSGSTTASWRWRRRRRTATTLARDSSRATSRWSSTAARELLVERPTSPHRFVAVSLPCHSGSITRTGSRTPISTSTTICATSVPPPGDERQPRTSRRSSQAKHLDRRRPLWEMYAIGARRRRGPR